MPALRSGDRGAAAPGRPPPAASGPARRPGTAAGPLASAAGRLASLAPVLHLDGPRVRLGLAWGAASGLAVVAGAAPAAVLFSIVAMAAAGQACSTWRVRSARPLRQVAVPGALVMPLVAPAGPLALGAAAALVGVAAVVATRAPALQSRRPGTAHSPPVTAAIALLIGLAAAAPVLVRARFGLMPAMVLLATAHAHDSAMFVFGAGATRRWHGPAAAVSAIAAVSLAVAALLAPPFTGPAPWLLGALSAVAAPLGPFAATLLLGRRRARVPALRRLDVLLLLGPAWALAAAALVDAGGR